MGASEPESLATEEQKHTKRPWLIPLAAGIVLLAAVLVRLYLLDLSAAAPEGGDQGEYFGRALMLASGEGYFDPSKWVRSPLYVFFLAGIFKVLGVSVLQVRLIQIVLTLLSAVLVYLVAGRLAGRWAGILAFGLTALFLPFLTVSNSVMSETLFVFLFLAAVYLLIRWVGSVDSWWPLIASGLVIGLAVLTRGYALLFVPLAAIWIWWAGRHKVDSLLPRIAVFIAAFLIVLAPWTLRNAMVYHSFIPVDTTGGYNFWLANGGFGDKSEMEKQLLPVSGYSARDRYAYQQGLTYIAGHPRQTLETVVTHGFYMGKLEYLPDLIRVDKEVSAANRIMDVALGDLPFLLAVLLGPAGLLLLKRRKEAGLLGLWLAFVFLLGLFTPVDFIGLRYRLPAMPVLFIGLAVFTTSVRWQVLRVRLTNPVPIALGVAALLVLLELFAYQNIPLVLGRVQSREVLHSQADSQLAKGDYAAAAATYGQVLSVQPDYLEAHLGRGLALLAEKKVDEAVKEFEAARTINPYDARPRAALGECYRRTGYPTKASKQFSVDDEQALLNWSFDSLPLAKNRIIDVGYLDQGYIKGFWASEKEGTSVFRRTSESSLVRFGPVVKAEYIAITMSSAGSEKPLKVVLKVNGVAAGQAMVQSAMQEYRFKVPASALNGAPLLVELDSEVIMLSDGADAHRAGVTVDTVKAEANG